jgi:hypothetical protein
MCLSVVWGDMASDISFVFMAVFIRLTISAKTNGMSFIRVVLTTTHCVKLLWYLEHPQTHSGSRPNLNSLPLIQMRIYICMYMKAIFYLWISMWKFSAVLEVHICVQTIRDAPNTILHYGGFETIYKSSQKIKQNHNWTANNTDVECLTYVSAIQLTNMRKTFISFDITRS